jgi:hypothetical protein
MTDMGSAQRKQDVENNALKQGVKNNKNMTKKSTFLTVPAKKNLKYYSKSEEESVESGRSSDDEEQNGPSGDG